MRSKTHTHTQYYTPCTHSLTYVCVFVCVCLCVCLCVSVCVYICVRVYVYERVCVHMYFPTCMNSFSACVILAEYVVT